MVKWKWISKEQMKGLFIGIALYSVCFAMIGWLFGVGLVAMGVSAFALMLFFVNSKKVEYNKFVLLSVLAVFSTIFLADTFVEIKYLNFSNPKTAWIKFYTVGALLAYFFMLIYNGRQGETK